jgi:hypothetical protein
MMEVDITEAWHSHVQFDDYVAVHADLLVERRGSQQPPHAQPAADALKTWKADGNLSQRTAKVLAQHNKPS